MSTRSPSSEAFISTADLADRLAAGEAITLLDVRANAEWTIEAPSATKLHVPAQRRRARRRPRRARRGHLQPGRHGAVRRPASCARWGSTRWSSRAGCAAGSRRWRRARWTSASRGSPSARCSAPDVAASPTSCAAGGDALVVDPAPDAAFYVALAAELGARIGDVVDTHLHADHLSGARALADQTGATLRLPAAALERGRRLRRPRATVA